MAAYLWTAIGSAVGSAALFGFIQFLISRHDSKKDRLAKIEKQQAKCERDNVRTQLLILMASYADKEEEILTLAEYYFKTLKGNFYMTTLFQKWLLENGIPIPLWLED